MEEDVTFRVTDGGGYVLESRASGTLLQLTDRMNSDSFLGTAAVAPPRQR